MAFNIVTYKIHEIAYISPFNKSNYLLLKYKIYQYYKNKFPSVYSVNELYHNSNCFVNTKTKKITKPL